MLNSLPAPTRTIENARRDTPLRDVDLAAFLRAITEIRWFGSCGRSSPWDVNAVRLRDWDEWTGPEDPAVLALAHHGQALRDELTAAASGREGELDDAGARAGEAVIGAAAGAVEFRPDADPYEPQSQCVWDAAYLAATIAGCLRLAFAVPADLHELWTWFAAGHWPCGFASDPADEPVAVRVL